MTLERSAEEFIQQLESIKLCLHPTDSIPGLAFDPRHDSALSLLLNFKKRSNEKSFIGLVANQKKALDYFAPSLPIMWQKALEVLWPAPLSVIYQAASLCPKSLVAADGSIALRVPRLAPEDTWFYTVLNTIDYPLPTTSVNHSGEQPRPDWKNAIALVEDFQEIYVPPIYRTNQMSQKTSDDHMLAQVSRPSTLIKIKTDGNFEILRPGLVDESIICDALTRTKVTDTQK